jgi:hypothetical protein
MRIIRLTIVLAGLIVVAASPSTPDTQLSNGPGAQFQAVTHFQNLPRFGGGVFRMRLL